MGKGAASKIIKFMGAASPPFKGPSPLFLTGAPPAGRLGGMEQLLKPLYETFGIGAAMAGRLTTLASILVLLLAGFLARLVTGLLLKTIVKKSVEKTRSRWDDILYESGFLRRALRLVPPVLILALLPVFFPVFEGVSEFFRRAVVAWFILMAAHSIGTFLEAANLIYQAANPDVARKRPVKGYLQMVKVFVWIVGGILVVTTVANISPVGILSGFGAMSAVLLLVFKDSIMGLVSSFQLSSNDMVRIGDWIEMPKYGADGDVIDVTLQSVKVRNWDMTITTIPIYALVSDSFKNWRGMSESSGRRIKRAISIDMQSVRFLTDEEKRRLSKLRLLSSYIEKKENEIAAHNKALGVAKSDKVSGRALTNLGTFRAYVSAYLDEHPMVEKGLTHMVRYLEGNPNGLPLELYLFCSDKAWVNYEAIQADIIDHLLAVMGEFGLRVFQAPSGANMETIANSVANPRE